MNRYIFDKKVTGSITALKNFFLTGPPRSGKTTLLMQIMSSLKEYNVRISGIMCPEVRRHGFRWGFKIIDLKRGREGILASIEVRKGPRISKYRVNLQDLEEIGVKALEEALVDNSQVVIIDEIGKMELVSPKFSRVVKSLLDSNKVILGIIHASYNHPLLNEIRRRNDTKIYWINRNTPENIRRNIHNEILKAILERLGGYAGN